MFNFFKKKVYKGEIVYLKEKYRVDEKEAYDGVPCVYYDIYTNDSNDKIGTIDLRLTIEGDNYYYGHIGYTVLPKYRGHSYAYYACKILFDIAKDEFKMNELIITCCRENIASFKTLEKLNGELIEEVDVPKNHTLYLLNEKRKCIFKYKLNELLN